MQVMWNVDAYHALALAQLTNDERIREARATELVQQVRSSTLLATPSATYSALILLVAKLRHASSPTRYTATDPSSC
jgi:hypothetical protein